MIREWYDMTRTVLDETISMDELENEANNITNKPGTTLPAYFQRAIDSFKCLAGLTNTECVAGLMYTDDSSNRAFFKEFNLASINRNWQPYKVYTSVLASALNKLARLEPLHPETTLYRGLHSRLEAPPVGHIFCKSFTSTTQDIEIATKICRTAENSSKVPTTSFSSCGTDKIFVKVWRSSAAAF